MAFAVEMAVQHGDFITEPAMKPFHSLRGEGDFRHQHDGATSLAQSMADGLQVNFSFAAAGYTMQEDYRRGMGVNRLLGQFQCAYLLRKQLKRLRWQYVQQCEVFRRLRSAVLPQMQKTVFFHLPQNIALACVRRMKSAWAVRLQRNCFKLRPRGVKVSIMALSAGKSAGSTYSSVRHQRAGARIAQGRTVRMAC